MEGLQKEWLHGILKKCMKNVNKFYKVSLLRTHPAIKVSLLKPKSLKKIRESFMLSKAELARNAGISSITISRIEQGKPCRIETQRKILLALGLKLSDKDKLFRDQA